MRLTWFLSFACIVFSRMLEPWTPQVTSLINEGMVGLDEIVFIGDSTMESLFRAFFPEVWLEASNWTQTGIPGRKSITLTKSTIDGKITSCRAFTSYECTVPEPAVKALHNASVVVVGFGLHSLHLWPERRCAFGPYSAVSPDCRADYADIVRSALTLARNASKGGDSASLIFWMTTNSICEESFDGRYAYALKNWHDPTKLATLEEKCVNEDTCFLDGVEGRCADRLFDRKSTSLQSNTGKRVVYNEAEYDDVRILDANKFTDRRCNFTDDGRHYRNLEPLIALDLLVQIHQARRLSKDEAKTSSATISYWLARAIKKLAELDKVVGRTS